MSDRILEAVRTGCEVIDLAWPLRIGMTQSPNHPPFWHTLPRRHGDFVRADGSSSANDMIVMGTHVGTHIDALSHVSFNGRLHGGEDADAASRGGRFLSLGVHTVAPIVSRAVMLDIPRFLGVDVCASGYEITPEDLEGCAQHQGLTVEAGDVVLIRSGWARLHEAGAAYLGAATGVPGVAEEGAKWLAERRPVAVGADTIAFERIVAGKGHALLPAHKVLLFENGIYIVEALNLEPLARRQIFEFVLALVPLNIEGATGSPIRPVAVVAA